MSAHLTSALSFEHPVSLPFRPGGREEVRADVLNQRTNGRRDDTATT